MLRLQPPQSANDQQNNATRICTCVRLYCSPMLHYRHRRSRQDRRLPDRVRWTRARVAARLSGVGLFLVENGKQQTLDLEARNGQPLRIQKRQKYLCAFGGASPGLFHSPSGVSHTRRRGLNVPYFPFRQVTPSDPIASPARLALSVSLGRDHDHAFRDIRGTCLAK